MDIVTKSFNTALNTLKAVGAEFVVIDKDGKMYTHGNLEVSEKKRTRMGSEFPRGTYINIVKQQGIENMKVGDVISFDPMGTRAESLRSTIIHYADKAWGKHTMTTSAVDGKIEALRIA